MIKKNFRSGQKDYGVQFRPGEPARRFCRKGDFDSFNRHADKTSLERRPGQRPHFHAARRIQFYPAELIQRNTREPEGRFNNETDGRRFPNHARQDGAGFQIQDFCARDCGQGQKAGDGDPQAGQSHGVVAPGGLGPESKKIPIGGGKI
jgi:hypothetical protein